MGKFVPNKLVQECIANNNIRGLKGAFVGIIFSDRSFSKGEFDETLDYVRRETNLEILEGFDGGELLSKKSSSGNISEDVFEEAVYNLKVNFCKERIDDVKKLGKYLYGKNIKPQTTIPSIENVKEIQGKKTQRHQINMKQKKESNTGLVIAGIVTAAAITVAVSLIMKAMK